MPRTPVNWALSECGVNVAYQTLPNQGENRFPKSKVAVLVSGWTSCLCKWLFVSTLMVMQLIWVIGICVNKDNSVMSVSVTVMALKYVLDVIINQNEYKPNARYTGIMGVTCLRKIRYVFLLSLFSVTSSNFILEVSLKSFFICDRLNSTRVT